MRADVLVYTSSPLVVAMELTGPITAVIHAASSAIDTDFTVVLADVFPDGRAIVGGTDDIAEARAAFARFVGI